jgi:hypothetical protein
METEKLLEAVKRASALRETFIAGPLARVRATLERGGFTRLTGGWVDVCAESGSLIFDHLLFAPWNGGAVPNPFHAHLGTLTAEGAFAIQQRLAMFHFSVFIRNEAHLRLLDQVRMSRDGFEARIFAAYEFADRERECLGKLDRLFDVDESQYAGAVYEELATTGYAMESRDFDPAPGLVTEKFGQVLRDGYAGVFMPRLAKALGRTL